MGTASKQSLLILMSHGGVLVWNQQTVVFNSSEEYIGDICVVIHRSTMYERAFYIQMTQDVILS